MASYPPFKGGVYIRAPKQEPPRTGVPAARVRQEEPETWRRERAGERSQAAGRVSFGHAFRHKGNALEEYLI